MCRTDVAELTAGPLARLLTEIRDALAAAAGVDPELVTVGPVDFGPADTQRQSTGD